MTSMAATWLTVSSLLSFGSAAQCRVVGPASKVLPHSTVSVTAAWGAFHGIWITAVCPTPRLPAGPAPGVMMVKPLVRTAFGGVSGGTRTPDTQDHNNAVRQQKPRKRLLFRDS